jgi:heme/copper-type cytochrome/quinol oxidase subunit 3
MADVSHLPTVVFGHRNPTWWGTIGFMLIEGTTLALVAASYLYVRKNYLAWPPERTPFPDLLIPTIQVGVMLLSLIPALLAKRSAHELNRGMTALWLWVSAVVGIAILTLRWFELAALNTRWDSHAYGSLAWTLLGLHGTLIVLDLFDTIGLAFLMSTGRASAKHFPAATENTDYWSFIMLSWIPLYILVFLSPRWL